VDSDLLDWKSFEHLPRATKTVLVLDLVESVRLMEQDEVGTVHRWQAVQRLVTRLLDSHHGRLVKSLGDGMMLEFEQSHHAAQLALAVQSDVTALNAGFSSFQRMQLRIGIHAASVYTGKLDIYGHGVNLAARLATLAAPGGIVCSTTVRDGLTDGLDASLEDLGDCYLKHVAEPVRAYRLGAAPNASEQRDQPLGWDAALPTLAIIPFDARSTDVEHLAIGELIADGLIAQLGQSEQLKVISRLATTALRDRDIALQETQAQLGADYIFRGSYLVHADKLLVSAELVNARTLEVLWAERLNGEVGDLLRAGSELCHVLASACHDAVLRTKVREAMYQPLPTLSGQALLFAGIAGVHHTHPKNFEYSAKALEAVIDRHPRAPEAYAWLAKWQAIRANRGVREPQMAARAAMLADQAVQRNPDSTFALTITGLIRSYFQQDLDSALTCYDAALLRNPNEALAWLYRGTLLAWKGEGQSAAIAARRALALAPIGAMQYYVESLAALPMMCAGEYDAAIRLFDRSVRLNANHLSSHRGLVLAYELSGRGAEATQAASRLMALHPTFTVSEFIRTYAGRDSAYGLELARALARAGVPRGTVHKTGEVGKWRI
jgi:adenylate cyclase